jgi:glycosyltransferase involved in cell wall biosynthesis
MTNSPAPEPRVSIILPCRNEARGIETCIASVLAQEPPPGEFEVIIADGMSDDGTREILARLAEEVAGKPADATPSPGGEDRGEGESLKSASAPGCLLRVIDNPDRIVSKGLNAAIRSARGEIIIRLDAHTEYAPDYVRECIAALRATGADNVGGPACTKAQTFIEKAVSAAYHSPFSVGGARFHDPDYEGYVDTVTYGCWPRSTFEKFGLFDEELVRNQDDEHNLRITRGGGKVYQSPKIKSWYRPRGSLAALFKQYMQYGYWKVRVIQKHKLPASWRHLVPGAFVLALLLLFLFSAFCFSLSLCSASSDPVVAGPWSVVHSVSHFSFLLSTFSFLLICSAYLFAVLVASVFTAARTEWKLLAVLPLVFGCYHFGYGFGFLRGILDFVILRRGASVSFTKLTRGSSEAKAAVRSP